MTSMTNNENMDNFAALSTSCLRFTFGKKSMQVSPPTSRILIFFSAFFYKFMLLEFCAKDAMGIIDHAQIASASVDPVEV